MDNPGFVAENNVRNRLPREENQDPGGPVIYEVEADSQETEGEDGDFKPLYSINDVPPWYLCFFLGLQHYLTAFGAILSIPLIIAPALCLGQNDVGTAQILSTLIFVSGLVTLFQTTIGTRLPIIQSGSFSYLAPTFAILSLDKWKCPVLPDYSNITLYNDTMREELDDYKEDLWQARMREIQGAIMLASLFQAFIGATGLLGLMLNFIGPLAIAPTIALVGIALFKPAADACAGQWWVALGTIVCIVVFSQYLSKCDVTCCRVIAKPSGDRGCVRKGKFPIFRLFPMLLAICLMWLVCYILTVTDTLADQPDQWGYRARTDTKIQVLNKAKWFRFPYPFQWGVPTFSVAGVFGMLAGVIAGMIESVGDYYACARLSGAPPPPIHAINRGTLIEGIGCVLAGIWGTGSGMTSYSENIGAIGITRVGSRVVVQVGAAIMLVLGMLGKFGALFVTLPEPIIGGVFMVTFGMIASVGISNLQYVNMNSSRNLFIVGFSFFFGLSLPTWMAQIENANAIKTGSEIADQILTVLLSTSMFVGGAVGFFLDNTIPGTEDERGIKKWRRRVARAGDGELSEQDQKELYTCYDLPWCMNCCIRKVTCFRYLPFCPTFDFQPSCRCCRKTQSRDLYDNHDVKPAETNTMKATTKNDVFVSSIDTRL